MNADRASVPPLDRRTKLAFGIGDLGTAATANLLIFYLSPFLTDVAHLTPDLAGKTQLVGKIWDAINDPLVGVMSDRTKSPQGRRYPWLLWGGIPFGIFFFLQWLVPFGPDHQIELFWFYTITSILFNSFYTIVNVPYSALTPELTRDYNERTTLNSYRFTFSIGGSILSAVLAIIIFSIGKDRQQQYLYLGIAAAIVGAIPIYLCVWGTSARSRLIGNSYADSETPVTIPILEQLRIVFTNIPFLFVIGIFLCSWLSLQLTAAIIPYFVTSWMRLEGNYTAYIIFAVQGTALLMLFPWAKITERIGKKGTYFIGTISWIVAQVGLFTLQPGELGKMIFFAILAGIGVSTAYLIPWSMLPDVIELDELNTGKRREGIFYSFMGFTQKICLGIAIAAVLNNLDRAGYIAPTATQSAPIQPDSVLLAIRMAICPLPATCLIIGLILAYLYPIGRERHQQILLQLQQRRDEASSEEG